MSLCQRSARCRHVAVIPNPGRTYAAPHRCSREVSVGHQGWPLAVGLGVLLLLLLLQRLRGHSCTALSLGEQWDSAGGDPHLQCLCVFCVSRNGTLKDAPSSPKLVGTSELLAQRGISRRVCWEEAEREGASVVSNMGCQNPGLHPIPLSGCSTWLPPQPPSSSPCGRCR